jgi:predicted NAD/FAD-dependent oxidoreductase
VGTARQQEEFGWVECSRCKKQRRVDLATMHVFDTREWRREAIRAARDELVATCPELHQLLHAWFAEVSTRPAAVTSPGALAFLRVHCGLAFANDERSPLWASALDLVVEFAEVFSR